MTPLDDYENKDKEKHAPVVITDKRHSRAIEDIEEPEAPPAPVAPAPAPPEPPQAAAPEAGVVEFTRPASAPPAEPPAVPEPPQAATPDPEEPDEEAYAAAEMEHLKMLFGAGLANYLRSQLGMLLNFSLIHLGRAPNPATGLVSTELDKAKLAIDLLEFIAVRLKGQLPAQEEQEIAQILAELKYTFLQLASNSPVPPASGGEA